ncbi:hypothetical protein V8C37DRAFT_417971 [Trichoderma ceciliae]
MTTHPLLQLTPILLLLLLYRLCPQHFPLSSTTTNLFTSYTIASQLLIHRVSPISLLRNLLLLLFAHALIAAIFILRYLASAAHLAQKALLALYVQLGRGVELGIGSLASHSAQIDGPCPSDDFSESPSSCSARAFSESSDGPVAPNPSPDEIFQLLHDSASSVLASLRKSFSCLHGSVRIVVAYSHHLLLSCLYTVVSLFDQEVWSLYITRIRFTLFIHRLVKPFSRISSCLVSLGNLFSLVIAIFTLHFVFCAVLLSIGEMYTLWACLLSILCMLSCLS